MLIFLWFPQKLNELNQITHYRRKGGKKRNSGKLEPIDWGHHTNSSDLSDWEVSMFFISQKLATGL